MLRWIATLTIADNGGRKDLDNVVDGGDDKDIGMCVYVCVYVSMYVRMCVCIYVCVCMCVRMYVCVYV